MRAVTPEDVRSGRESADTRWYLSNQLQKPLQRIFEMVMENASEIFEVNQTKTPQTISDDMMRTFVQRTAVNRAVKRKATTIQAKAKRRKTKPKDIRSFFN
jgi:DNA polymerase elongation subunit (family B)